MGEALQMTEASDKKKSWKHAKILQDVKVYVIEKYTENNIFLKEVDRFF